MVLPAREGLTLTGPVGREFIKKGSHSNYQKTQDLLSVPTMMVPGVLWAGAGFRHLALCGKPYKGQLRGIPHNLGCPAGQLFKLK